MSAPRVMRWAFVLAAFELAACAALFAQGSFRVLTGKPFESAFVKDFYLEGNSIPTEKRNAALIRTPSGARVEIAILDTSGYSSEVQEKYTGMIISEGSLSVCGVKLGVGSFGFGSEMPKPPATGSASFFFYDQGGKKLGQCSGARDASLKAPRPLQVVVSGGKARLYLGVYGLELGE